MSNLHIDDQKFFNNSKLKDAIDKITFIRNLNSIREFFRETDIEENVLETKAVLITSDYYHKKLQKSYDDFSPLMYLSSEQRKIFLEEIKLYKFGSNEILYSPIS